MDSVSGRVSKTHHQQSGRLTGFSLDCGCEVRLWCSVANSSVIMGLISVGSPVLILGDCREEPGGRKYIQAAQITNLSSKETVTMLAPVCLEKPGMLTRDTPTNQASLVPSGFNHSVNQAVPEPDLEAGACLPGVQSARPSSVEEKVNDHFKRPCASRARLLHRATSHDAAAVLVLAYDGLQRIQAILAYLEIVKRHVPGILQFLRETKHTYEQALLSYGAEDFASAREFASASAELSLLLDIFISRTLRSDSTYPSIVPPPPQHAPVVVESAELDEELNQLTTLLSRIHWLMENGTLPLEDRTQIRRIASWSDALYAQVRHMRANSPQDDAAEFMQAARAAANAAEHICRKWYVGDGTVRRPRPAPEQREA